jgi:phage FluMu protein Com
MMETEKSLYYAGSECPQCRMLNSSLQVMSVCPGTRPHYDSFRRPCKENKLRGFLGWNIDYIPCYQAPFCEGHWESTRNGDRPCPLWTSEKHLDMRCPRCNFQFAVGIFPQKGRSDSSPT